MIVVIDSRNKDAVRMVLNTNETSKVDAVLSNLVEGDSEDALRENFQEVEFDYIDLADYE